MKRPAREHYRTAMLYMRRPRIKVTSAWLKKMRKSFKAGDLVTWGNGLVWERIVEVLADGVKVANVSQPELGQPYFVRWNGESRITKTMNPARVLRKKNDPQ